MSIWRRKYKIYFLRKHFEALFIAKILETDEIKPIISLSGKKYTLNLQTPAFIGKQKVYFFDYDSGAQFAFEESIPLMKPEDLDLIVGQKIIKELTSGVIDNKKEKIFWVLMGIILGGLIAVVICMGVYNDKIQKLIAEYTKNVIPIIGTIVRSW